MCKEIEGLNLLPLTKQHLDVDLLSQRIEKLEEEKKRLMSKLEVAYENLETIQHKLTGLEEYLGIKS